VSWSREEKRTVAIAAAAAAGAAVIGLMFGAADVPTKELLATENRPILLLRLARVLLALTAGGGLAVAGVGLQAVLRNPLAEPYLMGTSSGAGLGAVIGILLGLTGLALPLTAFVGALATVFLVHRLSKQGPHAEPTSVILVGVVVSMALSGIIVFLVSVSPLETLRGVLWWLWGGLENNDLRVTAAVAAATIAGTAALFTLARELDAASLGEEDGIHLGVDVDRLRTILFYLTAFMTAAIVCVCGSIGFVGLIVPHACRSLVGPGHRRLIPVAALGGAAFLTTADVLSRVLMPPMEIPVGVITALIGAPIFLWLLRRRVAA
jgi:iron complex transport system permease protein